MRTDIAVNANASVRVPQIPLASPGRKAYAERGDWIEWGDGERGRVIGAITESGTQYICVACELLGGCVCELWIAPQDVYDCRAHFDNAKSAWLHGDAFLASDPDKARNAFNLLASQL